ncbi:hypothetical protein Dcar01_02292 [Deinococcus carri]|uniref:Prepilin-type N-terminal cleavage/methylation domain-containing protein n=1 Tax=Deinococcus carri TaxID=1211323 RepID=A0ABP9W8T9_9DEIO
MKRNAQAGFTLLELLVAMAIMGVVLMALLNYFSQGTRISTQSSSRAELQQEILNVQQLIAGRLKEAWYVYPSSQTLQLGSTPTSTAALRRNPVAGTARSGTANWLTGTDPVLAVILLPRDITGTCPDTTATTAQKEAGKDYCYRFFAYYPVKRSVWVTGTTDSGVPSASNPGDDSANGDVWVLAEYRKTLYGFKAGDTIPTSTLDGGDANILADYVAPTVATPGFTTTTPIDNTYTMFSLLPTGTSATVPVTGVTLNLATTRKIGGITLRLPNATDEYSITVYPTNLGKIAAN